MTKMYVSIFFIKTLGLCAWLACLYRLSSKYRTRITMSSSIFTTDKLPEDERLMATVGNGYLATQIYSDTVYISGVYNGLGQSPSHRARVPSTAAIRWSVLPDDVDLHTSYSLDIGRGIFTQASNGVGFQINETIYAHRSKKHLLIVQFDIKNERNEPLVVKLINNGGNRSADISFRDVPDTSAYLSEEVHAMYGEITEPEVADGEKVGVAVVSTLLPDSLTIPAYCERTYYFHTVIVTSLTTVDYLQSACQFYKECRDEEATVLESHVRQWRKIWDKANITLEGNTKLAQTISGSLYYLLSSVHESWPYGLSPGSLSSNDYWGHSFWDTETWMYPTLLMLYPDIARSLLLYRYERIDMARRNAQKHNISGTMFPWESAFTGCPVCPEDVYENYEVHVNGDIGFAVEQYWMTTHDPQWLHDIGIPLIRGLAEFWASRVTYDNVTDDYVINHVMCPDEYHSNVNNSAFTNAVAKRNLEFASRVVPSAPALWRQIAKRMRIPFDTSHQYHPEYDGYNLSVTVKQADVILLGYPLMYNMTEKIRANDLRVYEARTDPDGPAMTKAMFAIGWLEIGEITNASESFSKSYQNARDPFKIWTEYPSGDGAVNFITGMGGFLQAIIFGYGGLRLYPEEIRLNPRLPESSTKLTLHGLHYRGNAFDVAISQTETQVCVTSREISAPLLVLTVVKSGEIFKLESGKEITFQNGAVVIKVDTDNIA